MKRCGSCLQYGTETRSFIGTDGQEHTFCIDQDACERRWQGVKEAERFAAAEARIYDPEPGDDDE